MPELHDDRPTYAQLREAIQAVQSLSPKSMEAVLAHHVIRYIADRQRHGYEWSSLMLANIYLSHRAVAIIKFGNAEAVLEALEKHQIPPESTDTDYLEMHYQAYRRYYPKPRDRDFVVARHCLITLPGKRLFRDDAIPVEIANANWKHDYYPGGEYHNGYPMAAIPPQKTEDYASMRLYVGGANASVHAPFLREIPVHPTPPPRRTFWQKLSGRP